VLASSFDSALVLHWRFADGAGSPLVRDTSGHGTSGAVTGPVTLGSAHGGSAFFNGPQGQIKAGQIATTGTVIDTAHSFTISMWVDQTGVTTPTQYASTFSQDGTTCSGFSFTYSVASKQWSFSRSASDSASPVVDDTWSKAQPLNTWILLTGVYDTAAGTVSLYVDGTPASSLHTSSAPYASNGPFAVGRSWYGAYPSNPFDGGIADVRVYGRALTPAEVQSLVNA
jgi:hypothetical protein